MRIEMIDDRHELSLRACEAIYQGLSRSSPLERGWGCVSWVTIHCKLFTISFVRDTKEPKSRATAPYAKNYCISAKPSELGYRLKQRMLLRLIYNFLYATEPEAVCLLGCVYSAVIASLWSNLFRFWVEVPLSLRVCEAIIEGLGVCLFEQLPTVTVNCTLLTASPTSDNHFPLRFGFWFVPAG